MLPSSGSSLWNSHRAGTPVARSLAARLLRVIFGCYFLVAVAVTAGQMTTEYRSAHGRLEADVEAMRRTFGRGLAEAMWSFNDDVLRGILTGVAEMPVVAGVEVRDEHGRVVASLGMQGERTRPTFFDKPFDRRFALSYTDEHGQAHPVGSWTVRSNDDIALEQVRDTLIVILINSVLKTLTLWAIFFVVIRRMVGRPLAEIGAFLEGLDADSLGAQPLHLRTRGSHELHLLAAAFNAMASKLRRSFDDNAKLLLDLQDANATLQSRVAERTHDLEMLAWTDQLTGLHNRRKLDEVMDSEIRRARSGARFSVVLGDIDHFKSINDHHGHRVGDAVLVAFAATLRDGVRADDIVGRWGGEEFMVLCPDTDLEAACALAERLRRRVEEMELPAAGARTCSFGVAELHPGEGLDLLLTRVDAALYAAKHGGRNRIAASERPGEAANWRPAA